MFELKKLTKEGLAAALQKAERYRMLNEPWEAESICRDVLKVDPGNQEALVSLILSLTDQFGTVGGEEFNEARTLLEKLDGEYEQAYYMGIFCERRAKAYFERANPGAGSMAHQWYTKAMSWFEKAEEMRPPGNEEATLRWNTCARTIMKQPTIQPAPVDETENMLE